MKDGELKEVAPEVFEQWSCSWSRKPSPTKRPRLQGLEEEGGVIVAAEVQWSDQIGDEEDDEEDLSASSENDTTIYRRGRKRLRSPLPLNREDTQVSPAGGRR